MTTIINGDGNGLTRPDVLAPIFEGLKRQLTLLTPYRQTLDDTDPDYWGSEDIVTLLVALKGDGREDAGGLIGALQGIARDLEAELADRMKRNEEAIGPWNVIRRGGSGTIKYEGRRVAQAVAQRVAETLIVDPETGELLEEQPHPRDVATEVADAISRVANLDNAVRAGELRKLGWSPDTFGERKPGRVSIQVQRLADVIEGEESAA